jgi:hypothetical protein
MARGSHPEGVVRSKLSDRIGHYWLAGLVLTALTGLGFTPAQAENTTKPQIVRPANTSASLVTSGSGPYYVEFRSRFAWDYGHTYIVHGRVGEAPTKASVAGLSPVGDDATAWVIGHYVPVPAETGWTDGDLEDKYVTARYRVLMNKDQYDRVMGFVRDLQSRSHTWSAELYNCNAFVGDIAKFMGLSVPSSSLIYPKVFINNLRKINTGHPEAAEQLVSDNMKEMSSPTRDGRAMITSGVRTIRPDGTPTTEPATSSPSVTIGTIRASTKPTGPVAVTTAPSR